MKNQLSIEGINELEELYEYYHMEQTQDKSSLISVLQGLSYYSSFLVETNLNFKVKNAKGKEVPAGIVPRWSL